MKTFASITGGLRPCTAAIAAVLLAVASPAAHAQAITGGISFTGGAQLNSAVSNATAYTAFFLPGAAGPPMISGTSGTYDTVPPLNEPYPGTPPIFYTFSFLPFNGPQMLWSLTIGDVTYSFTANSLSEQTTLISLTLQGTGFLSITGYADTPATWSYTDTGRFGTAGPLSFIATMTAAPEPSTLLLLTAFGLAIGAARISRRTL